MNVKPAIVIRREESECLFIIKDPQVTKIRQGTNEIICSVPSEWVGEAVAIIYRPIPGSDTEVERFGIWIGNAIAKVDWLGIAHTVSKEAVNGFIKDGKVIYNGSEYTLIE